MAKGRLTPLSKLLIVLLIVGGIFFGVQYLLKSGLIGGENGGGGTSPNPDQPKTNQPKTNIKNNSDDDVVDIGVVTWGGYAAGQYWNKGFDANTQSNFYKDYGF